MKEEAGRTGVQPLQVVQDQEQRASSGYLLQDTGVLFKKRALLQVGVRGQRRLARHQRLQPRHPSRGEIIRILACRRTAQQRASGQ
jgi:hypothetical protein